MEDQKKNLILVLEKLIPYRNLAEGVISRIKTDYISQKMLNEIAEMINHALKNVKNESQKEYLNEALHHIEKIKQKEEVEKQQDEQEADDLLDNILDA